MTQNGETVEPTLTAQLDEAHARLRELKPEGYASIADWAVSDPDGEAVASRAAFEGAGIESKEPNSLASISAEIARIVGTHLRQRRQLKLF